MRDVRSVAILTRALLLAAFVVLPATGAVAGDFFEEAGVAIRGYDPVAYFSDKAPVKGSPQFKTEYRGSTFHFRSQANRDAFVADPAKFAPQYGGFCAFGAAGGYKAATQPAAFTIADDKLYLNYNRDVQKKWSTDIPGYVQAADRKWPEVSTQKKVVP